jgi:hypothetical protein
MVVCFYMRQQWKWKSTGILSFLQKKQRNTEPWTIDMSLNKFTLCKRWELSSLCWVLYFFEWIHSNTVCCEKRRASKDNQNHSDWMKSSTPQPTCLNIENNLSIWTILKMIENFPQVGFCKTYTNAIDRVNSYLFGT